MVIGIVEWLSYRLLAQLLPITTVRAHWLAGSMWQSSYKQNGCTKNQSSGGETVTVRAEAFHTSDSGFRQTQQAIHTMLLITGEILKKAFCFTPGYFTDPDTPPT